MPATISATARSTAASPSTASSPGVLLVRRVGLPEYLMSRHVRYRAEASTLAEWPAVVWAERIEIAISRELVSALRSALPGWTLCEPGCAAAIGTTPSVLQVDLTPLDFLRAQGRLQAQARVTMLPAGGTPRQSVFDYDIAAVADTPQAHAQALATLLGQLSAAVAQGMQNLPPPAP